MTRNARSLRLLSIACWGIAACLTLSWVVSLVTFFLQPQSGLIGKDFQMYVEAASRWVGGGPFYLARQLAGPYEVVHGDVLYPPTALPLFIAFTFLPGVLWWIIPLMATAWLVGAHHPSPLAWAGIALCLWFPATSVKIVTGNPVMWCVLAVAAGTRWGWPGALALMKPTLAPFALVGITRRSWWIALAGMGLLAVALAPLTLDWLRVVIDARTPGGVLYSLQEVPMMALPVLAWLGRRPGPVREGPPYKW